MEVKQHKQEQKDTKETVRDIEGTSLERGKLAICVRSSFPRDIATKALTSFHQMLFLTFQTVDSQRKLRQAITLAELYQEGTAIGPDSIRTVKMDTLSKEMKEGYKLLYKTNMPNIKRGKSSRRRRSF